MSVKIIVDSACDLAAEQMQELGLACAPLKTILGGKEYRDGVDIRPDAFYGLLEANKELAHTSQVNAAEFADLFAKTLGEGDEAVVITLSSGLSGTYQAAMVAAGDFEGRVLVVDSLSATAGEQVLIAHAVKLRDAGKSAKEIFDELQALRHRVRLFVRVETLEYLKRGGRVSKTAAFVGGLLQFMPLLTLNGEGKLETVGKARGAKMSHKMMNDSIAAAGGIDFSMPVCMTFAGYLTDSRISAYLADSKAVYGEKEGALQIGQLGCVIGTHTGPGAIVVAFVANEQ